MMASVTQCVTYEAVMLFLCGVVTKEKGQCTGLTLFEVPKQGTAYSVPYTLVHFSGEMCHLWGHYDH